jgi:hypothetical protein
MSSRSNQPVRAGADRTHEFWLQWQHDVLKVIQSEFCSVLDRVEWDDIDWDAWRPLYERGCSAQVAVRSAFGRVA